MKSKFILIASLIGINASLQAQSSFEKTLNTGANDYGNMLKSDNGVLHIIGTTNATTGGHNDALYVISTGAGAVLSNIHAGGTGAEFGSALFVSATGEMTAAGRSSSYSGNGIQDVFVARLDATGVPVFMNAMGTDSLEYASAVKEANDGGIIIGGRIKPSNRLDGLVIKLNTTGAVEWANSVGTPYANEVIYDIEPLGSNIGYLAAGYSGVNVIGLNEATFTLLNDADGSMGGTFLFGGTGDDDARMIVPSVSGKFFIMGNTRSFGVGQGDIFVAKFDVSGPMPGLEWFKTYGSTGEEAFTSAVATADGAVITGITSSYGTGGDALAFEIDATGAVQWAKNYGGTSNDAFQSIISNGTLGYTVLGYSNSFSNSSDNDLWLLNLDLNGVSGCNETNVNLVAVTQNATYITPPNAPTADFVTTPAIIATRSAIVSTGANSSTTNTLCIGTDISSLEAKELQLYPVPSTGKFQVETTSAAIQSIAIFDASGMKIRDYANLNTHTFQVELDDCAAGIYSLRIQTGNETIYKKAVIAK